MIITKPLSPELLGDFLSFFDDIAFVDNHDWGGCYCLFNQYSGAEGEWMGRAAAQNRSDVIALIRAGKMKGYLAYIDGNVAGWCNANDRSAYTTVPQADAMEGRQARKCCSIVCFIVAPAFRRKGVSRELLRRVCTDSAALGYDFVEAYPRGEAETCAQNYHGHLNLYLSEGFSICRQIGGISVVRKTL